jgi:CHASE2 domain-containing sensor protein
MKIVLVILLLAVLGALASAGVFMTRRKPGEDRDTRMARALALRVGLSVTAFLLVMLAWWMGWIQPTGIPAGR